MSALLLEKNGPVATLTINRPELTKEDEQKLMQAVRNNKTSE